MTEPRDPSPSAPAAAPEVDARVLILWDGA